MAGAVRLLALLALASPVLCAHDLSDKYPFHTELNADYTLYWTFDNAAENITFAVRVRTTGWVGFGVSPNGQMPQSDVVIGWVDGDTSYFHDRFATGRFTPPVDPVQNWFLISAEEEDGYTTLEFTRNYTTCDSRDRNIKHETANVIWSYHQDDPANSDGPTTRHTNQGSAPVNLLGGLVGAPAIPPNAKRLNVNVNNVLIPSDVTTYWCFAMRYPQEIEQQTQYIIRYEPIIAESSKPYVHHITVYVCDTLDGVTLDGGGPCDSVDRRIRECRSSGSLGGWAVGGAGFTYPENIAFPIGGGVDHTGFGRYMYIVMEMHYNNPDQVPGVRDSSGMSYIYVSTPRMHDAGSIDLGHLVHPALVLPPEAENYTVTSICPTDCTRRGLPTEGIRVFGTLLHTHLSGVGVEVSVLRRNNQCSTSRYEEVAIIDNNPNYDFNFQQTTHLPNEVTVLPGDVIMIRCHYRTIGRTGVTLGGEPTSNEMCLAFLNYYPKVNLRHCLTIPSFDRFNEFVQEYVPQNLRGLIDAINQNSPASQISSALNQLTWTNEMRRALQDNLYDKGTQATICSILPFDLTTTNEFNPRVCCPFEEPNTCTGTTPPSCCSRTCPAIRVVGAGAAVVSHISVLITLLTMALLASLY